MVVTEPRMTVSGAAPAIPKNTTDGTPRRLRASARETMSGPALSSAFAMDSLQIWVAVPGNLLVRKCRPRLLTGDLPRGRSRPAPRCGRRAGAGRPATTRRPRAGTRGPGGARRGPTAHAG